MKILAAFAILIALAVPVFAQDDLNAFRRYEFGYNVFSYSRQGPVNSFGGELSFTKYYSERFGIVAEFALHDRTTTGEKRTTSVYQFGPRYVVKQGKRVRAFGEVLAGGSRITNSSSASVAGGTANGFSLAIGGGVDVAIRPWLALRPAQLDYSLFRISGGTSGGIRAGSGLVFRFVR